MEHHTPPAARPLKLVNLTPHAINWKGETIPVSGKVARLTENVDGVQSLGPILTLGPVENLPDPVDGVKLIVSRPVAMVVCRLDVVCPHDLIRDDEGRIVGCETFASFIAPEDTE